VAATAAVALKLGEHTIRLIEPLLGTALARTSPGRQRNVLRHRELAEYLAFLGSKAYSGARNLKRPQAGNVASGKFDGAGDGLAKSHDAAQAGRFAGAVAAYQAHELAGVDVKAHPAQHRAAHDIHRKRSDREHQCCLRLPTTAAMS